MHTALVIAAWVVGGIVGLVIAYLIFLLFWTIFADSNPKGVELSIESPATCEVDEEFAIVVRIKDTLGKPRTINDIDIQSRYLAGIVVMRVDPTPAASDRAFGDYCYTMKRAVPPGGTEEVRFICKGVLSGDHSGDMTIYVDSKSLRYFTHLLRTIVADPSDRRSGTIRPTVVAATPSVTLI